MITPFNREEIFTDSSSEAAANVWGALKAAGVPYAMKTRQSRGAYGRAITTAAGMKAYGGGMAASSYSDQIQYVYTIYVRRRDAARARSLCDLPDRK